jgi:hypothetical protein
MEMNEPDCGSGNISCDNCGGDGKRDAVMVTVMLVVVSVHHQVMSDVLNCDGDGT